MTIELTALIALSCTVLGATIGLAGHRRNSRKDIAEEAKGNAVILTELGYVKSGIDDIKRKQESQDAQVTNMSVEVAKIKASTESAHKRIDRMEGKVE